MNQLVGESVMRKLSGVKPNSWNPNTMTDHQYASLLEGFREDGWIASQALLVWGTDEAGKRKNIIIDGEHRWRAAQELGYTEAPMVVMRGITEAVAKSLTIKLDAKRGQFDSEQLTLLVKEIALELDGDCSLSLGIENLDDLLDSDPVPLDVGSKASLHSENSHTKMVPLYMTPAGYEDFMQHIDEIGSASGVDKTISEIVLESIATVMGGEL